MTEHYLDRLARTINENWDAPALTDFYLTEDGTAQDTSRGKHYTYGEMYLEILRLGKLFKQLGLQKGDHIAICGANSAHWAIAYLAIAAYQGVVVTVLHTQLPEDIARQVAFSDAKALFTDEDLWRELKVQSMPQIEQVISLDCWQILQGEEVHISNYELMGCQYEACFDHGNLDDLAVICFTSGTTGVSKGVMLSNNNISTNVSVLLREFIERPLSHSIAFLPMSHAGVFVSYIIILCRGAKLHVLSSAGHQELFSIYSLVKPQEVVMVPMMLQKLIESLDYNDDYQMLSTRIKQLFGDGFDSFFLGGAKISLELENILKASNLNYAIGYGTTECAPFISIEMPSYIKQGTVGKVVSSLCCQIAPNGEILVKGDNVMLGYYKNPEATAQKIDAEGWLHTGDRGYLDEDGYLYVEGRLEQDMIVLPNGENIHPDNIESKINALPEVAESIVVAREGKLVAIVVVSGELSADSRTALRLSILRSVNAQLPMYAQLYDIEWSASPLARTVKQTLKRHLYK